MVLVLAGGRPMAIADEAAMAGAVLMAWHPGLYGGSAVAGILSGRICPSGRLAMTFPADQGQIPIYYGRRNSARRHQGFYKDRSSEPLYGFGHGLSYTSFAYGEPVASAVEVAPGGKVDITVPVTNTGGCDGMETVFWYVSDPYGSVTRPAKELRHFEKRMVRKGTTELFTFHVDVGRDLGFVDGDGRRMVEPGEVAIHVGGKSVRLVIRE